MVSLGLTRFRIAFIPIGAATDSAVLIKIAEDYKV